MAYYCALCGNKLGMMESINREFRDEKNRGTCLKCHRIFLEKIRPEVEEMLNNGIPFSQISKEIVEKYAYVEEGKVYLADFLNSIFSECKSKEQEETWRQTQVELMKKVEVHKATTGYNFDGYRIVDYKGIVSGETVIGTGIFSELAASTSDLFGVESNSFADKMRGTKQSALMKLKAQSVLVGGNAVIGVDFDYINFSNNMIGVSANGTAVVIEKIED